MGQYYRPIVLNEDKKTVKEYASSYVFHEGAKLMEHSYIDNLLVNCVEEKLLDNPTRLVWAGDYADPENGKEEGPNLYDLSSEQGKNMFADAPQKGFGEIWDASDEQLSKWFPAWGKVVELGKQDAPDTFVLNHDKKQYYVRPKKKGGELTINPLPLLTAEGNGRGGGDYQGTHMKLIGTWARDSIEYVTDKSLVPEDYKVIKPSFVESR